MKNNNAVRGCIILGAIFVAWLVTVLVAPFVKGTAYWLSFAFTLIAFVLQLYVFKISFSKGIDARSKFYGFPIARIGALYLIAQLALGLLAMALTKWVPAWVDAIVFVVILAIAAIGCITADIMRDEVERQDIKLKTDVSVMRSMQCKVSVLVNQCKNPELKDELKKLEEDFRFSDPVSNEALVDSESSLAACLDELQNSLANGNVETATASCRKAKTMLVERNRLCKLNK